MAAERSTIVNEWVQNMRALKILSWIDFFESRIFKKRIDETNNRISMVTNGQLMSSLGSTVTFFINLAAISSFVYLSPQKLSPGS